MPSTKLTTNPLEVVIALKTVFLLTIAAAGLFQTLSSPANANQAPEIWLSEPSFDIRGMHDPQRESSARLRREDISCYLKGLGYIYCKARGQNSYATCGHGGNKSFHYLSFGSPKNPACPAALYFGYFDNLERLPREEPN